MIRWGLVLTGVHIAAAILADADLPLASVPFPAPQNII